MWKHLILMSQITTQVYTTLCMHAQGVKMLPKKTLMAPLYQMMIQTMKITLQLINNLYIHAQQPKICSNLLVFSAKCSTMICILSDLSPLVLVFILQTVVYYKHQYFTVFVTTNFFIYLNVCFDKIIGFILQSKLIPTALD